MKTMLFNPYTGTPRHPSDISSDPEGIMLLDPDEPVRAPTQPRPLTTRELADVTAPWSNIWTDQSFGIANAAVAKFCEVNGITAQEPTE